MLSVHMKGSENILDNISFFHKKPFTCIVCEEKNYREELRMGRGRLDAGKLDLDLQRHYIASKEYGTVLPILYNVVTCNYCYFSYLITDDISKLRKQSIIALQGEQKSEERIALLKGIIKEVPNFSFKRNLVMSLGAYILAIASYNQFLKEESPTLRLAIVTLRCAWICKLMHSFGYVAETEQLMKIFYRKAAFLYQKSIDMQEKGEEDYREIKTYGPDTDRDYGFDGFIYMNSWLQFNYGELNNHDIREKVLMNIRSTLSKVFGFGKSTKEKPSALLYQARNTFDLVEEELKSIQSE